MTTAPTSLQRVRVAIWFAGVWAKAYWPLFAVVYAAGFVCGLAFGASPVQP